MTARPVKRTVEQAARRLADEVIVGTVAGARKHASNEAELHRYIYSALVWTAWAAVLRDRERQRRARRRGAR